MKTTASFLGVMLMLNVLGGQGGIVVKKPGLFQVEKSKSLALSRSKAKLGAPLADPARNLRLQRTFKNSA